MHRDIKPENILINRSKKLLKIIDWGLADFYLPGRSFNLRIATRYYRAPEVLLGNQFYDYSMDIWAAGCWFAGLVVIVFTQIFMKRVFFKGDDNIDQFKKILEVLGTTDAQNYLMKYGLKPDILIEKCLKFESPKYPFEAYRLAVNFPLTTPLALDLLKQLLVIDHVGSLLCRMNG
jgi:casein kinase II subunit alpha